MLIKNSVFFPAPKNTTDLSWHDHIRVFLGLLLKIRTSVLCFILIQQRKWSKRHLFLCHFPCDFVFSMQYDVRLSVSCSASDSHNFTPWLYFPNMTQHPCSVVQTSPLPWCFIETAACRVDCGCVCAQSESLSMTHLCQEVALVIEYYSETQKHHTRQYLHQQQH